MSMLCCRTCQMNVPTWSMEWEDESHGRTCHMHNQQEVLVMWLYSWLWPFSPIMIWLSMAYGLYKVWLFENQNKCWWYGNGTHTIWLYSPYCMVMVHSSSPLFSCPPLPTLFLPSLSLLQPLSHDDLSFLGMTAYHLLLYSLPIHINMAGNAEGNRKAEGNGKACYCSVKYHNGMKWELIFEINW